jgi:hypothetical protein
MFIDVLLRRVPVLNHFFTSGLKLGGGETKHLALKLGGKDQTSCQTIWKKKLHAN